MKQIKVGDNIFNLWLDDFVPDDTIYRFNPEVESLADIYNLNDSLTRVMLKNDPSKKFPNLIMSNKSWNKIKEALEVYNATSR